MAHGLVGWNKNFALMPYGDSWREHRKVFHRQFQPNAICNYHAYMYKQARNMLGRLIAEPGALMRHLRFMAGATILRVSYGINAQPEHDHYLEIMEEAVHSLVEVGNTGAYMVDLIPALRYLPSWMPGARFKQDAARWSKQVDKMFDEPFEVVKQDLAEGNSTNCVCASLLSEIDDSADEKRQETVIKHAVGTAYIGGADTTVSSLATFVLAMMQYPHVQRIAQEEIERVTGRYNIPAGSIVMGNAWAVLHDEDRYPNPESFEPARFLTAGGDLDKDAPDSLEAGFGFGRRICAGMDFAQDSMWINIAYMLATLDIEKPMDETGNVIEPSGEYTTGLLEQPLPFKVSFKPRSKAAEALMYEAAFYD
ncbi:uncharacterized protein PHACADRAFT_191492 [Phanerochaete carnosa HHB-10118-sp]|uniref:Cytochrome P450 n=1 Tax=Phanerochaete carnosa (strain HHB-10118-sp) TaxID=650164 RepID=K5W5H7_PHACS|nr:uncharacterized protein PHACADRAFT_191492 [Phanerochaete carnosa HHB-10118-sp]EKM59173.1 hypothetical protein PHACADRAFT_191492 [Phanerochaete carnosa HHB-10118-sp]